MATQSIGKANLTVGAHDNHYSKVEQEGSGFVSSFHRFMSSAQELADKYADYKYNQTDWRAIRP